MSVKFPDVPLFDGVPAVYRSAANAVGVTSRGVAQQAADATGEIVVARPKGWGVYTADGVVALAVDSIYAVEPGREFRIADYPQEAGGFLSYNKVATPGEVRLTVTKGGYKSTDRQAFLRELDALVETTDLYSIVTPERVFERYNIVRYDYRRTAEAGARLITVEILATEVRESAQSQFTTTKAPSGADPVNGGPVRPVTPTPAQTPVQAPQ